MWIRVAPGTAAIAALFVLITVACGGDDEEPPTASPEPSPALTAAASTTRTPTPTPTPGVIDQVEVVPFQIGEEAELPEDVALIIETGCFSCDGPATGLYRVYRDASGELRTDKLFTIDALGLPPRGVSISKEGTWPQQPFIHSYALNSNASEIVVSICTRGECAWIDPAGPDAQTTLYRSLDGGVTWSEFGVLDGESWVVAVARDGIVVAGPYGTEPDPQPNYRLFPSGQPVQPPPGAGQAWPLSLPNGDLIWRTDDGRLLRSDGTELLDLGEDVTSVNIWRKNVQLDPGGERLAIVWRTQGPGQTGHNYLGESTTDGRLMRVLSLGEYAGVGGWVDSRLLVGNASFSPEQLATPYPDFMGYLPALFDLDAGQLRPLKQPFLDPPFQYQRNHIQAVQHGPFARVVNTGACLNVRADPGVVAPVLACAADGVLLRDTGETREVDGTTWLRVVTPSGAEGWASTQYLER